MTQDLHLDRVGRPTVPTTREDDWKTVRIRGYVWESLAQLADARQEPIYKLVEEAVAAHFSAVFKTPDDVHHLPLSDLIARLSKSSRYPVSPNAFVSAIKKGRIFGVKKVYNGRRQWFVNHEEAEQYYLRKIHAKRHRNRPEYQDMRYQAAQRQREHDTNGNGGGDGR